MLAPGDDEAAETSPAPPRGRAPRRLDPALVAIVVLAAGLRLWGLGRSSWWYDEWLTAVAAKGDLTHLRHYVTDQAGIPPTFFGLEWLWARLAGTGELALRLPSALAGIAVVPVAAVAARAWGLGRPGRLVAALLVATNPMLVWYSQEARPYSLVALAVAVSLVHLPRWCMDGRRRDLGAWAFAAAMAVALHYYAVFLVLAEALVVLWRRRPSGRDLPALAPAALVAVGLVPFAMDQTGRRANHAWIRDWPLALRWRELRDSALVGVAHGGVTWVVYGSAVVAVVAAVASRPRPASGTDGDHPREAERSGVLLVGFGVAGVVGPWALNAFGVDGFLARYLIGSIVAVAVAVAVAADRPVTRRFALPAAAVLVTAGLMASIAVQRDPFLRKAPWREVAAAFETADRSGPAILVLDRNISEVRPVTWYLPARHALGAAERIEVREIDVVALADDPNPCNWFVGRACSFLFLGAALAGDLAGAFREVQRERIGSMVLVRYRADRPVPVTPDDLAAVTGAAPFVLA